jgi:hypothetical protein
MQPELPGAPSLRFLYARVGGHEPPTGESVSPFYLLHKITTIRRTLFIRDSAMTNNLRPNIAWANSSQPLYLPSVRRRRRQKKYFFAFFTFFCEEIKISDK